MQICPKGHPIPELANGYCARCAQEERNSWQRGRPKKFDPDRYLGTGGSQAPFSVARPSVPPDKRMPDFSRLEKSDATPKAKPAPKRVVKPKVSQTPTAPTFSPQRVLEGIETLVDLVSEKEMNLELLLARAAVQPEKMRVFRSGRHAFVQDVRERWFALFKAILQREEARVIVRKVGLDGLTAVTSMEELAERCQLSVEETRQHGRSGLRKLREFTNRHAVLACVTNSARQLLR